MWQKLNKYWFILLLHLSIMPMLQSRHWNLKQGEKRLGEKEPSLKEDTKWSEAVTADS